MLRAAKTPLKAAAAGVSLDETMRGWWSSWPPRRRTRLHRRWWVLVWFGLVRKPVYPVKGLDFIAHKMFMNSSIWTSRVYGQV